FGSRSVSARLCFGNATARATTRPLQAAQVAGQAGLLAFALTQEVELGPANNTATLDRDIGDARAVQGERPLDAFPGNNAAHLDGAADATAVECDDRAGEQLHALLLAFLNQVVHVDGIADPKVGKRGLHVLEFELAHDVHGSVLSVLRLVWSRLDNVSVLFEAA